MKPRKSEAIYDGITDVREDIVENARNPEEKKKRKPWQPAAVAAVVVIALVSSIVLWPRGSSEGPTAADPAVSNPAVSRPSAAGPEVDGTSSALSAYGLAIADYPEMAPYPNESDYSKANGEFDSEGYYEAYDKWWKDKRSITAVDMGRFAELKDFLSASAAEFLTGVGADNLVYSPVNVYMALAMLAETTNGNSQEQILNLLDVDSIETLRSQATALWRSCYCNDGAVTSILASSLWLNQDVEFIQDTMDTLAETYYASSFQGEMGSEEYNQALRDWLNEQTGGLLAGQVQGLEMDADTILTIASTLYFKAPWQTEFQKDVTAPDIFHAANGDITCDFMHQTNIATYYWGDHFTAVSLPLHESSSMWFLLPDEGTSVDQLLESGEAMEFLLHDKESPEFAEIAKADGIEEDFQVWENQKYMIVNLTVPKFDVSSDLELTSGLQNLGITDVFNGMCSDFTPLTNQMDEIYVSQVQHAARVTIDEEGCTAAAYTVLSMDGAGMPGDEVDFVLDRPFLFAITNNQGMPLFVGVVNQPVS